jgi:hypothetical protein
VIAGRAGGKEHTADADWATRNLHEEARALIFAMWGYRNLFPADKIPSACIFPVVYR